MRKTGLIFLIFLFFALPGKAQLNRYIIEITDKAYNNYSIQAPWQFLSSRALERRSRYNIAIDSTDLPITARYIDSIRLAGDVTILNTSKWLNQVAIYTTDMAALARILNFPFVKKSTPVAPRMSNVNAVRNKFETAVIDISPENFGAPVFTENLASAFNYGMSNGQVKIHKGEFLHNLGFQGQGMQMAILDGGFRNYLTLPTFDSVRTNNQILGTWDFVLNASNVNGFDSHGTHCFSTIAAHMPGSFVGTAPKTSFYLYRTEDVPTEYVIEEQNLAAGLERADSSGADMASISLGYYVFQDSTFNYTYANMDGNTTISARAADAAARKGMLIITANGNEGTRPWHYLITPADADSVLSVGAVDTLGNIAAFSSYGPSSDGQIKPGVAAVGLNAVVANANTGQPAYNSGTSFACPNMAGLASCLWQAFPEENNMGIMSALQQSASQASTPDDRVGYGIPDMKKAFVLLLKRFYSQQIQQAGCNTLIKWSAKNATDMSFEVQRKLPTDADYISIHTNNGSGSFASRNFAFNDDLSSLVTPISISYRIKMNIATDTSFYFTPVTINHITTCTTYSFTGNGNWTDAANWESGMLPPAVLPAGSTIIINPAGNGECILNSSQQIAEGAYFTVMPGKKLLVPGNLNIQQ
jgi:serine protease AprX